MTNGVPGRRAGRIRMGLLPVVLTLASLGTAYGLARFAVAQEISPGAALNTERNGVITGRVTLDDGKPAVGFRVIANFQRHRHRAPGQGAAITDANGEYCIQGLSPQGFRVQVENGDRPYLPDAPRLVELDKLPDKTASGIDFVLHPGPLVTVRVRDAQSGAPIPGLPVNASFLMGVGGPPRGTTDANGELRFRASSLQLQMSIEPDYTHGQPFSVAPGSSFFKGVQLSKIEDVVWDVRTYREDSSAQAPVTFKGIVTGPDGKRVAGAKVRMIREGLGQSRKSDQEGCFSFQTNRMHVTEYGSWNGRNRLGILIEAEKDGLYATHYATPEETWTTIPVRLSANDPRGSVIGQVVSPGGAPLAGVPIQCDASYLDAGAFVQMGQRGISGPDGRFTMERLSPEAYHRFTFGGSPMDGSPTKFGVTTTPSAESMSGWLRLQPGERRHDLGKVTVWRADAVVAGQVTEGPLQLQRRSAQGRLLAVVEGKHTRVTTIVDPATGRFRLEPVVREPLTLYVYYSDPGDSFRSSPGSSDEVGRKTVQAGDEAVTVALQ